MIQCKFMCFAEYFLCQSPCPTWELSLRRSQRCCHYELLSSWAMKKQRVQKLEYKTSYLTGYAWFHTVTWLPNGVSQGSYLLVWHPGATSAVSDPCWWISHKPPAEALLRELEQTKQAEQTLETKRRMEILPGARGSCVRKLAHASLFVPSFATMKRVCPV